MRKTFLAAALLCASMTAVSAKDVTVVLSDDQQQNFFAVPQILESCTAAAALRGDTTACRQLYPFLAEFAARIRGLQPPPAPAAVTPAPTPDIPAPPPK